MDAATIDVASAWHELGERLRVYLARRVDLDSFGDIPEPPGDPVEQRIGALAACLERMLDTLGEGDADVLRKVDLDGAAQVELAVVLGVPRSRLKSRGQRARTKLRAAFDACCAFEQGDHCASRCDG